MNTRELKSKLESNLEELYEAVTKVTNEGSIKALERNIKYHQIAYTKLIGNRYIPKSRRLDDWQEEADRQR